MVVWNRITGEIAILPATSRATAVPPEQGDGENARPSSWPQSSAAGAGRQDIAEPSAMLHPVGQQESETALGGVASQDVAAKSSTAERACENRLTFRSATMRSEIVP